jgi:hypothetical protein
MYCPTHAIQTTSTELRRLLSIIGSAQSVMFARLHHPDAAAMNRIPPSAHRAGLQVQYTWILVCLDNIPL